jgi:translocation and assembly module TamA
VILLFDSGTRYRFGQISFPGDTLDPSFLIRYVKFKPGDPYDSGALQTLQSDLINSNYFSRVELIAPHEKAVEYRIPIAVTLEMRNPRQLSFGLGYGTDTGVRGKIGFEQRWVNRWGHRFNAELIASQIKYSLAANYMIPGADPSTDSYNLYTALKREKSDVKDFSSAGVGGNWKKQLGVWERVLSLDYGVETFRFEEDQTSKLLMPGVRFTRTVADDPLNVSRGSRLELSTRGAYEPLLSDLSFLQPRVSAKLIRSRGNKNRVIVRAEAGTTFVSDFTLLPASLRFYAGGDNSVRGYDLDKIGPQDNDGNVIGGKHLVVGSLELEREVWNKWSAALFLDTGDAFNDTPELKTGVGLGVRWQSPVGPIRVDIAHALDKPPGDTIRLHISIGPEL